MLNIKEPDPVNSVRSNKAKYAVDLMMRGYMCSESILMAFANEFAIDPETASRIAGGFAGGMAQGKTCGAVTGAIMIIGLQYGAGLVRDQYSRDMCFQTTQEFSHRFIERRKTVECDEILLKNRINPKDPEDMKNLREKGLCDKIVKDAVEILEELLNEEI